MAEHYDSPIGESLLSSAALELPRKLSNAATKELVAAGVPETELLAAQHDDFSLLRLVAGAVVTPRFSPACALRPNPLRFLHSFPNACASPDFSLHWSLLRSIREGLDAFAEVPNRAVRIVGTYDSEVDLLLARARHDGAVVAIVDSDTSQSVRAIHFAPSVVDAINFALLGLGDIPADEEVEPIRGTGDDGRVARRFFHRDLFLEPTVRLRHWIAFYADINRPSARGRGIGNAIKCGRNWE